MSLPIITSNEIRELFTEHWPNLSNGIYDYGTGCSPESVRPIMISEHTYTAFPSVEILNQMLDKLEVWKRDYIANVWNCNDFATAAKGIMLWEAYKAGQLQKQAAFATIWGNPLMGSSGCHAINAAIVKTGEKENKYFGIMEDIFSVYLVEPQAHKKHREALPDDQVNFVFI